MVAILLPFQATANSKHGCRAPAVPLPECSFQLICITALKFCCKEIWHILNDKQNYGDDYLSSETGVMKKNAELHILIL